MSIALVGHAKVLLSLSLPSPVLEAYQVDNLGQEVITPHNKLCGHNAIHCLLS